MNEFAAKRMFSISFPNLILEIISVNQQFNRNTGPTQPRAAYGEWNWRKHLLIFDQAHGKHVVRDWDPARESGWLAKGGRLRAA